MTAEDLRASEPGHLTANQRFRHNDLVTNHFVILSQSEGLGKMALEIVKYAYDHSSQLIGVIWFAVSLFPVSLLGQLVWTPSKGLISSINQQSVLT